MSETSFGSEASSSTRVVPSAKAAPTLAELDEWANRPSPKRRRFMQGNASEAQARPPAAERTMTIEERRVWTAWMKEEEKKENQRELAALEKVWPRCCECAQPVVRPVAVNICPICHEYVHADCHDLHFGEESAAVQSIPETRGGDALVARSRSRTPTSQRSPSPSPAHLRMMATLIEAGASDLAAAWRARRAAALGVK